MGLFQNIAIRDIDLQGGVGIRGWRLSPLLAPHHHTNIFTSKEDPIFRIFHVT
jgi:hypothetical protein